MPAGTVIAEAAGSSRSVDLQICTPSREYEDQVGLPDAAMRASGLVDIERLSTVPDLTDSEREFRCRDLLDSLKPPREREDRAQRMSISASSIIANAAGRSLPDLSNAERHTSCSDLLDSVNPDVESIARMNVLAHSATGVRRRDLPNNSVKDHENEAERRARARKR